LAGAWLGEHPKKFGPPTYPTYLCNRWSWQLQIWYTSWVWRVAYQETTFRTKIGGDRGWGASKKIGTPYLFLQPLKVATSNLVHNVGMGSKLQ